MIIWLSDEYFCSDAISENLELDFMQVCYYKLCPVTTSQTSFLKIWYAR